MWYGRLSVIGPQRTHAIDDDYDDGDDDDVDDGDDDYTAKNNSSYHNRDR